MKSGDNIFDLAMNKFKALFECPLFHISDISNLGPIHTRHFCTQYSEIAIKRYLDFSQDISIEQPR
jgi:hypothetical protein